VALFLAVAISAIPPRIASGHASLPSILDAPLSFGRRDKMAAVFAPVAASPATVSAAAAGAGRSFPNSHLPAPKTPLPSFVSIPHR